jgi:sterol desaturase/sphingolipid hydroxylase (fatty acid hydroxylase superfamily)
MTSWLYEHQAQLQWYLWLGTFALVAVWESFKPRRRLITVTGARWFNNIALTSLGALLAQFCLPLAAFSFAVLAEERGWGLFNQLPLPFWLSCALAVLIMDFATYGIHRLFHVIPALWRCHKIHHTDLDVDCGTAIRHHPIEFLIAAGADLAIIAAIGAPPLAVFIAVALGAVASVFNHGNVAIPTTIDRLLRRIVVTPDMHRIHHSVVVAEGNRNFANLFTWWDYLFSTYQREPRRGHEGMDLGIGDARAAADVTLWQLLAMPFRRPHVAVASPSTGEELSG